MINMFEWPGFVLASRTSEGALLIERTLKERTFEQSIDLCEIVSTYSTHYLIRNLLEDKTYAHVYGKSALNV